MIRVNSLRARMTVSVTVAFAVWMLLVCLGLMVYAGRSASRQADSTLNATALVLRRDLTDTSPIETREQSGDSPDVVRTALSVGTEII